jgi:hypothetical protein
MRYVDILCLANSFKRDGRCVAGVRLDTGEWIRPVTDSPDGTLPYERGEIDGAPIRPLDVLRVRLDRPAPRLHQPENWTIGHEPWTLVTPGRYPEALSRLKPLLRGQRAVLGTTGDRISLEEIRCLKDHTSLTLIKAARPEFRRVQSDGKEQMRCRFRHGLAEYDLSVTEDRNALRDFGMPVGDGPHRSSRDWYLTISLTEPWNGSCYKIVAGAMPGGVIRAGPTPASRSQLGFL